ncbi:MAG: type II toxin-antitoxin system HigB family toxin [Bryobacterales bacterium]|nr:type II toxin-antitoxin system HigB family toxin [Bryobacterales bacterium]
MRILSKLAITEFTKKHKEALDPLMHWYHVAKQAHWANLVEVRQDFRHADPVGRFTVFNVGGNNYRLVTVIAYRTQIIYIRHILTHLEYDKEKWKQ